METMAVIHADRLVEYEQVQRLELLGVTFDELGSTQTSVDARIRSAFKHRPIMESRGKLQPRLNA